MHKRPIGVTPPLIAAALQWRHGVESRSDDDRLVPGGPQRRGGDDAACRWAPAAQAYVVVRLRPGGEVSALPGPVPAPPGAAGRRHRGRRPAAVPGPRLAVRRRGPLRRHPVAGAERARRRRGPTWRCRGRWRSGTAGSGWPRSGRRRRPAAGRRARRCPSRRRRRRRPGGPVFDNLDPSLEHAWHPVALSRELRPGRLAAGPAARPELDAAPGRGRRVRRARRRSASASGSALVWLAPAEPADVRLDVPEAADRRFVTGWLLPVRSPGPAGPLADTFLDATHGPFVHAATIGAPDQARGRPRTEVTPEPGGFSGVQEQWCDNPLDPEVATGGRPLRQRRRTTYTYRAPVPAAAAAGVPGLRRRRRRSSYLLQPEDLDSTRIYTSPAALLRPGAAAAHARRRSPPQVALQHADPGGGRALAGRAGDHRAARSTCATRCTCRPTGSGVALRRALCDFASAAAGQRRRPDLSRRAAPPRRRGSGSAGPRRPAGRTPGRPGAAQQAGSPPSSGRWASRSVTAPASRRPRAVVGRHVGDRPPPTHPVVPPGQCSSSGVTLPRTQRFPVSAGTLGPCPVPLLRRTALTAAALAVPVGWVDPRRLGPAHARWARTAAGCARSSPARRTSPTASSTTRSRPRRWPPRTPATACCGSGTRSGTSACPAARSRWRTPSCPAEAAELAVTWFGHASALLEVDGARVLVDPVWGFRVSPSPVFGPTRLHEPPIAARGAAAGRRRPHLARPLRPPGPADRAGAARRRSRRRSSSRSASVSTCASGACPDDRIVELDWDQSTTVGGLTLTCTEARHFSGRYFYRDTTLWASWAITGPRHRVFFGGDTGYHPAFAGIGARLGPFDLTLLPVGAYNDAWHAIHMDPEEAVRAHGDLGGRRAPADPLGHVQPGLPPLGRAGAAHCWPRRRAAGVQVVVPHAGRADRRARPAGARPTGGRRSARPRRTAPGTTPRGRAARCWCGRRPGCCGSAPERHARARKTRPSPST